ncbi:hypothetical protein N7532_001124 [Penicillium argentinense]|uniref:Dienelactone hydrolase n=1 Tax=Penicillium argentinense TaxID=1131581 RepID=A0A9W9G1W2_9EURO|nr:uncharacterized protein N7532_001124 [Penicillium argentinense]KAJ5110589.1 hypothetical protein N7532_001124 [Penicillium argentinense]
MATISISAPGLSQGLLYNNGNNNARVCITSETNEFDQQTIQEWQDEGFDVVYHPLNNGGKDYESRLKSVKEGLGVGENYAVIAFGEAASYCLDYYMKPMNANRLCALVAYYPTVIPDTRQSFPLSLPVLAHLPGNTIDVMTQPQALGLQGKRRRKTRELQPGLGTGERIQLAYPAFTYDYAQPGFAEHDMEEYNNLAADLAWTRTVQTLRKGFCRDPDLERLWEDHQEAKFFRSNLNKTLDGYVQQKTPGVTYTPTLTGGIGNQALRRFYEHYFLGRLPQSMRIRLLSRTSGSDRIVDELYVSFQHTDEIPWMLPGVPATNKRVEIVLVSIVSLRGGRLYSEHVYWDQASVLVQVGLLDPRLAPDNPHGIDRLPVIGREAARRILHEDTDLEQEDYHNRLIRRANARARMARGSRTSQAPEESGAEMKSEVETSLPVRHKGKSIQKEDNPESNRTATDITEQADDEHDGVATETGSTANPKPENGDRKAYVEDGEGENGHEQA